jgi:anti-sigma factor RsiW
MSCVENRTLLHALLDGELDARHARGVEAHLEDCTTCSGQIHALRAMQEAIASAALRFDAPMNLRRRIEKALRQPGRRSADHGAASRRAVLRGFVMGTALSTAMAASLVVTVIRSDEQERVLGDVVSAHVRSLQGDHLTDVQTSDQHTVKPWFNGKLDLAPPVVDLTAQGFTLIGGRLDYLDARPAASIVYRRRKHVINLFVAPAADSRAQAAKLETSQGYNICRWSAQGLEFFAVSDINADELREFVGRFDRQADL